MLFRDRREAGRRLAARLTGYAHRDDAIVLALPRGGIPVGFEVARALGLPLDVFVVRKLGVPGREELAMGAIASGGVVVLSRDLIGALGISDDEVREVAAAEREELHRREALFREGRPPLDVRDRTVLVVDDGLATGSTMMAAVAALRRLGPARIVVAVPVGAPRTSSALGRDADDVVCLESPEDFFGVGQFYRDFSQTSDDEVRALLGVAREGAESAGPPEG